MLLLLRMSAYAYAYALVKTSVNKEKSAYNKVLRIVTLSNIFFS